MGETVAGSFRKRAARLAAPTLHARKIALHDDSRADERRQLIHSALAFLRLGRVTVFETVSEEEVAN